VSSFEICNFDEFVAEVTPQVASLEDAGSAQEILIQQIEGYFQRMRAAICADVVALQAAIEAITPGSTTFLGLIDTPGTYAGAAGDVATVNAGQTALEFITPGGGALPDLVDDVEISSGRQVAGNDTFFKLRDIGALPNTATKTVVHNIGAAFALVDMWGVGNDPSAPSSISLNFVTNSAASNNVWMHTDATNIIIVAGTNRSNYSNSFIVLEYYYL
jgi:hypothetical protein